VGRKKNKTTEVKTVEPIRSKEELEAMKAALKKISYRDYMVFLFGINTGLRISDILKLKVGDVRGKTAVWISEGKTHKPRKIHIKNGFKAELDEYIQGMSDDDFLFPSKRNKDKPVDQIRVYRVFNQAAEAAGIHANIGTHTMRKTFGYHFYKQFKDVAKLQKILNHSAPSVTLRYIGIEDEEIEKTFEDFEL